MRDNVVGQVRPESTFENFDPKTESQKQALELMLKLAQTIEAMDQQFLAKQYPFKNARILVLSGATGRGKSHLIEAFINYLQHKAPNAYKAIFLARTDFTLSNIGCISEYGNKPIVVLDDLYARYQSVDQLNDSTDIRIFMEFIMKIYEERRLIVMTMNFPFLAEVVARISAVDKIGRVISRLEETVSNSFGEIVLDGPDGRKEKSSKGRNPFDL